MRHWISNHEAGIGNQAVMPPGRRTPPRTATPSATSSTARKAISRSAGEASDTFLGKEQSPGPTETRPAPDLFANFLDVMRTRKRSDLIAEIEEGAISTTLVHLANISYRLGRSLQFDAGTYTCKGDAQANAMFTRPQYRAPFVVPKVV